MAPTNGWFTVDKEGLAALLEARGKEFALFELISNSWDEPGVTEVKVRLQRTLTAGRWVLNVEDNAPEGFTDLADAYRLFGTSRKRSNPTVRGRFNLGEKLVLAIADEADIVTTGGTVSFHADGTRSIHTDGVSRRREGSLIRAVLRMRDTEAHAAFRATRRLISPPGIRTIVGDEALPEREPVRVIQVRSLPSVIEEAGVMRRTSRNTEVALYEPLPGEVPSVYELGVPVVECGDRWHYDVRQKVPLNQDRDNVPPSFLRRLRTEVLNAMAEEVEPEEASSTWVGEALQSDDVAPEAVQAVITSRFGPKAVSFDLSDPEANKLAVSNGFTVVHGGTFSKAAWENIRAAGALQPAGKVTPSNRVEFTSSPDGIPPIDSDEWSPEMRIMAAHARALAVHLLGKPVAVSWYPDLPGRTGIHCLASYGSGRLTLSKKGLRSYLAHVAESALAIDRLYLHEFAHDRESDHLSARYHEAICDLGARMRGAPTVADAITSVLVGRP